MKNITQAQLIKKSNIPAKLVRAVVKQSGGWESFKEMAPDITNHGISGGFSGWINYSDTIAFWKRNKKEIIELANNAASDQGENVFELIQGFGVFRYAPISATDLAEALYTGKNEYATQVQNVMAWFAAEEVARALNDLVES